MRRADRRIARLLRQGSALDLARAYAARVDALIESEEHDEAFAQLEELTALLGRIEDPAAPRLLAAALARRVRLAFGHDERRAGALADVERGLVAVARSAAAPEVSELEVELLIHRGRLLNLAGEPDAARVPLERAITLADGLPPRARRLFLVRARRELGVALAQGDLDLGLAALDIAEGHLDEGDLNDPLPEAEGQLLASTRAEVLAARPPEEDWPLLQRAATLEMADRDEEAREVGARLIERLQEQLDGRDPGACHELAEALLAQARRVHGDEERLALAVRAIGALEDFVRLPARSLRLLGQALELQATCLEAEEAHESLRRRAHVLEGLLRDVDTDDDRVELTRTYLQDGDCLMRMGQPPAARRLYAWAIAELRRLDPDHPAVHGLLPLALNAHGHALAAGELWLAARRRLDEAVGAISPHTTPAGLARLGDMFMFRAIAHVSSGDPEGAANRLRDDVSRLLGVALREPSGSADAASLVEAVMNLCVLRAEVLVDHLDQVDEACECYDQALALCELTPEGKQAEVSLLGAKAAMLTERDRAADAVPLLERCVAQLRKEHGPNGNGARGDLAQVLIALAASQTCSGEPRLALGTIQQADGLLSMDPEDDADDDDDDDDDGGPEADGEDEDDDDDDDDREAQRSLVRSGLLQQRGAALLSVGHPLLAADDYTRAIDLCRALLEGEGDGRYDAQHRLPQALLERARAWIGAGEHEDDARLDLRDARRLFRLLYEEEARPLHGRRLEEVRVLQRSLHEPASAEDDAGDGEA